MQVYVVRNQVCRGEERWTHLGSDSGQVLCQNPPEPDQCVTSGLVRQTNIVSALARLTALAETEQPFTLASLVV